MGLTTEIRPVASLTGVQQKSYPPRFVAPQESSAIMHFKGDSIPTKTLNGPKDAFNHC
jgi:hypothetical protein